MSFAIVITGTPGVGKSTVSRKLAQRLPLSAHVKADDLQRFIISGGHWPSAETALAREQLLLRTRNAVTVAKNFVSAGVPAWIDEVICDSAQLDVLDELLPGCSIVALAAKPDVVRARDAGRNKQMAALYTQVAGQIEQLLAGRAHWIESSEMSLEQTVDAVWQVVMGSQLES